MQSVYGQLRSVHVPNERIHAEAFGPAGLRRDDAAGMPPAATGAVSVLFARSGKEARWMPESGSLPDLAEARGLIPPYSCCSWTCGSRSEEHTSELQSLMRISYAVFCLHTKLTCSNITQ